MTLSSACSKVHTDRILRLSLDLPIVVEVERPDQTEAGER